MSNYIYAGARIKTLENNLLSEIQLERLISSPSLTETNKALQDTFLAPYLENNNLSDALEKNIAETRELLESISPDRDVLDILWLKYDWHNLKTIIKGKKINWTDEEILNQCFFSGEYQPEKILKLYSENKLGLINEFFKQAIKESENIDDSLQISHILNKYYFLNIEDVAQKSKNDFAIDFVTLLADIYNLKTALRCLKIRPEEMKVAFVPVGNFKLSDLEEENLILENFRKIGKEKIWQPALEEYKKDGSFLFLKKASEEHIMLYLKDKSFNAFSPASLFAFFSAKKNNIQIIQMVIEGKNAGLSEEEIRTSLRRLYTVLE